MPCRADAPRSNPTRAILNFFFLKNWRDLDFYEKWNVLWEPLRGKCQFGGWKQMTTALTLPNLYSFVSLTSYTRLARKFGPNHSSRMQNFRLTCVAQNLKIFAYFSSLVFTESCCNFAMLSRLPPALFSSAPYWLLMGPLANHHDHDRKLVTQ